MFKKFLLPLLLLGIPAVTLSLAGSQTPSPQTSTSAKATNSPEAKNNSSCMRRLRRKSLPWDLSLTLKGQAIAGKKFLYRLVARLEIPTRLPGEPILKIVLPQGARLINGKASETIVPQKVPQKLIRTFLVYNPTKEPVHLLAEASSSFGGVKTIRSFSSSSTPKKTVLQKAPQITQLKKPLNIGGILIRQVIKLSPKKLKQQEQSPPQHKPAPSRLPSFEEKYLQTLPLKKSSAALSP